MSLTFVTSNKGKIREFSEMLGMKLENVNLGLEEIQDIDIAIVAIHKAKQAYSILKTPVIVDDSGLHIKEWGGFPGPFLAHIVKSGGMPLLLSMMKGSVDRTATFKVVIAYCDGQKPLSFEGTLEGSIAHEIRGENGFGIDGVFIPKGSSKTLAEHSSAEKNSISHRSKAIQKLKDFLKEEGTHI